MLNEGLELRNKFGVAPMIIADGEYSFGVLMKDVFTFSLATDFGFLGSLIAPGIGSYIGWAIGW